MELFIFKGTDICKLKLAIDIRTEVFIKEQGVSNDEEFDDKDPVSYYILIKEKNKPIGCGRVYFQNNIAHLGRIAVIKEQRKNGVGRIVVENLIEIAKGKLPEAITLGAQLQAAPFYEKLGFKSYGDVYTDAGIEHINMSYSEM